MLSRARLVSIKRIISSLNMRRSFRGRAVPPKETVEPMPVLFPDSFNRNQQGEQTRVRFRTFLALDQQLIYDIGWITRFYY